MSNPLLIKAVAKYVRISPYKARRILNQIRGHTYQETLMMLEFLPYKASEPIWQVIYSAGSNAKNNYNVKKKNLVIDQVFADEGPKLKRIRPRAQGRAFKILRPTCHLTVVLRSLA